MSRIRILFAALILSVLCVLPAQADGDTVLTETSSVSHKFQSFSLARDYLKQMMIKRETSVTFTLNSTAKDGQQLMDDLLSAVLTTTSTTAAREGDYLEIHLEARTGTVSTTPVYDAANVFQYYEHTFSYVFTYYTTWKQEAELTTRISQVLADLQLEDKTTFEKIETIYNYVCSHVTYSYSQTDLDFSAYGALVNRKAVCQGYAALLYRLLRAEGIECRIIKGTAGGAAHAWNIVKIGNYFYNMDATWDAGKDEDDYKYFLKTEAEFTNHTREAAYSTAAFTAEYPMATESFCFGNHAWAAAYTIDVEPTCSSYGLKSIHCTRCDEVMEGSLTQVDKKPHAYGAWKTVTRATVFKKGEKVKTCSVCGEQKTASIKKVTPFVTLNAASARMKKGQESTALQIAAMGNGDSVAKWESSKSGVVSVTRKTGRLKAKKTGKAVITVTMKSGVTASCTIKVGTGRVTAKAIAFDKKKLSMEVGAALNLQLVYTPIMATDSVTYKYSANGVLEVSADGVVTAKKKGTGYVRATTESGLTTKCKIVVK